RRLALVRLQPHPEVMERLLDLCDPANLLEHAIKPDELAAASTVTTRAIADAIHARGHTGLRWWSAFRGEWHTVTLFLDRSPLAEVEFSPPEALSLDHPAVVKAAESLMIRIQH
ncbi:MAG TPA: RES domain-containing protein, partial [Longimicrobiaceae bacterium]|nr:RES domain-containing protein [Longimicrobiaceae bacterium]